MRVYRLGHRVCLGLTVLLLSGILGTVYPAAAAICRDTGTHHVCIVSIKRSAKNYWEYRAAVRIDDVTRPIEVYNCRDRYRIRQDGKSVPFQLHGAGDVICKFFKP